MNIIQKMYKLHKLQIYKALDEYRGVWYNYQTPLVLIGGDGKMKINNNNRIYIAIDLKSFYASVECVERCLNPLTTNLVVADRSRTEKTICLAVSPSLKAYGIPGRARLIEVVQKV